MDFQITHSGKNDLSAQIYSALRSAILGGRLRPGQLLPSTRELAVQLRVARKTVLRAYERLRSESLMEGRVGAGTHVSSLLFISRQAPPKHGSLLSPPLDWPSLTRPHTRADHPFRFAFDIGVPEISISVWYLAQPSG